MASKGKPNKGLKTLQSGEVAKPKRTVAEQEAIDASEKRERVAQELKDSFKEVAKSKAGQVVLAQLVRSCGVFRVAAHMGNEGYDVNATTYNLGRQSVYMASIRPFLMEFPELLNIIERPVSD